MLKRSYQNGNEGSRRKEGKDKLMLALALEQSNVKAVEIEAKSHILDDLSIR